jgi:gas vesicle protein
MNLIGQSSSWNDSNVALALVAGMLIGAGFALVCAPQSGAELRADLGRRFGFDRNERFRKKVDAEGGFPGPVKHAGP